MPLGNFSPRKRPVSGRLQKRVLRAVTVLSGGLEAEPPTVPFIGKPSGPQGAALQSFQTNRPPAVQEKSRSRITAFQRSVSSRIGQCALFSNQIHSFFGASSVSNQARANSEGVLRSCRPCVM